MVPLSISVLLRAFTVSHCFYLSIVSVPLRLSRTFELFLIFHQEPFSLSAGLEPRPPPLREFTLSYITITLQPLCSLPSLTIYNFNYLFYARGPCYRPYQTRHLEAQAHEKIRKDKS